MDLDSILNQFGEKTKAPASSSGKFNADEILSMFGDKPDVVVKAEPKKASSNVAGEPHPPISGVSKEASDELNSQRALKGEENPRRKLPTTNIQESIIHNFNLGRESFSEGLNDITLNKPASGVAKTAMGALGAISAPITGLIEGGVSTPITDITGNKRIGDTAGLIVGSGLPVVKGAGVVTGALPKNKALSTLVKHIGPENLSTVVSAMKSNPRLAPADLSPKVLQSTQELFANGGPQVNYLKNTSDARMAIRKDTIEAAYDASAGVSPDLAQKITDLAQASKKVGNEKIEPAIKAAGPVNITSTMAEIDKVLKPGVTSVISGESSLPLTAVKKELAQIKAMLGNDKEMRTNAADLHKFQSGLRTTAESLMKSATAADKEMGKALMNVRNNLVSDIDKAAPGYKPALSSYRDEMHIADAFREGHDKILTSSKKIENDPSFVKKWFDGLNEYEKQAAKEGVRTAIHTEMGVAKNPALAGESVMRSDFNKAKMETILGKEETAKLFKALEDERAIADTHNKIVGGSQTAMRDATKSEWQRPEKSELNNMVPYAAEAIGAYTTGLPAVGALAYQGLKGLNNVSYKIKTAIAKEREAQYAKLALPTEGPSRDELIRQLESFIPQPKLSMLNKVRTALPTSTP